VSRVKGQNASTYLPKGIDATLIKGFTKQKDLLAKVFASDNIPAFETAFGGACSRGNVNLKPLSRGSINIDPSNPNGDPVVDFRAFSNPLDLELNTVMVRYTRLFNEAPTLAQLGPVELIPGSNVTTDADIAQYLRNGVLPSTFHPCGTAAMMPVELGGVVGSDLLVHGVRNLRIIDASIMPIIPSAHLSATVYAIAEKVCQTMPWPNLLNTNEMRLRLLISSRLRNTAEDVCWSNSSLSTSKETCEVLYFLQLLNMIHLDHCVVFVMCCRLDFQV